MGTPLLGGGSSAHAMGPGLQNCLQCLLLPGVQPPSFGVLLAQPVQLPMGKRLPQPTQAAKPAQGCRVATEHLRQWPQGVLLTTECCCAPGGETSSQRGLHSSQGHIRAAAGKEPQQPLRVTQGSREEERTWSQQQGR